MEHEQKRIDKGNGRTRAGSSVIFYDFFLFVMGIRYNKFGDFVGETQKID